MSEEEFCARFKAEMLRLAGEAFDDGSSIGGYADMIASSYFEAHRDDGETPEDCASADISYWEDG